MGQLDPGAPGEKETETIMNQLETKMEKNQFRPLLSSENQNIRLRPDRTVDGFVWERGMKNSLQLLVLYLYLFLSGPHSD